MTIGNVSVVIPTFNAAPFISATVQSVRNQIFPDIQLVVVDNNSTDSTLEVLRELEVPFVTESTQGGGAARNRGLLEVTTDAVLFLDNDDLLQPNALAQLVSLLEESGADAVYGRIRNHAIVGHAYESNMKSTSRIVAESQMAPLASSTLIRRSTFTKYGIFEEDNFSFMRWIVRSRDAGARFEGLDEEVALRGIHGGNVSLRENSMAEFFKIIRARTPRAGNSQ
jgi:glycosyltransferase involved in cell wall biosynthesis